MKGNLQPPEHLEFGTAENHLKISAAVWLLPPSGGRAEADGGREGGPGMRLQHLVAGEDVQAAGGCVRGGE